MEELMLLYKNIIDVSDVDLGINLRRLDELGDEEIIKYAGKYIKSDNNPGFDGFFNKWIMPLGTFKVRIYDYCIKIYPYYCDMLERTVYSPNYEEKEYVNGRLIKKTTYLDSLELCNP